jgi:hypothetical protein
VVGSELGEYDITKLGGIGCKFMSIQPADNFWSIEWGEIQIINIQFSQTIKYKIIKMIITVFNVLSYFESFTNPIRTKIVLRLKYI